MPAYLVPITPGLCVVPLDNSNNVVLIGRQSDCDVSLTQSRKVSRRHCCVVRVNDQFFARDLGSTNGIYLNGQRVKRQCRINLGDEFMIGDLKFRLQNDYRPMTEKAAKAVSAAAKPTPLVSRMSGGELPSMDIPVILPEEGQDFVVEPSLDRVPLPHLVAPLPGARPVDRSISEVKPASPSSKPLVRRDSFPLVDEGANFAKSRSVKPAPKAADLTADSNDEIEVLPLSSDVDDVVPLGSDAGI